MAVPAGRIDRLAARPFTYPDLSLRQSADNRFPAARARRRVDLPRSARDDRTTEVARISVRPAARTGFDSLRKVLVGRIWGRLPIDRCTRRLPHSILSTIRRGSRLDPLPPADSSASRCRTARWVVSHAAGWSKNVRSTLCAVPDILLALAICSRNASNSTKARFLCGKNN